MSDQAEKKKPGRPAATYKQGGGAKPLTMRCDDDEIRRFVQNYPGKLAGIVRDAFERAKT